jgi:tetratricopeptide (TPR) repeat protein
LRRYRPSPGGESEYAFRHALVRDVAYGQISRARRGEKHLLAAGWFESLGRPEDHAETAAHHYLGALEYVRAVGGDVEPFAEQARESLRRAGDRALALNAFASAARFFGGALALSPRDEERAGLLFSYGKALSRSATPDEDVLMQARDSMVAAGDVERAAECEVILAELHWRSGQRERAFDRVGEAIALLDDQPPSYAKAYAFNALAQFQIRGDESGAALDSSRAAIRIAEELGLDDLRADALITIGLARVTTGDVGGLEDLEHSIQIAEESNSPQGIRGHLNLASMLASLGDLRRAAALYAQGHRLAERFGDAAWAELFEVERLYEQYWRGEWDEAWSLAEELLTRADRGSSPHLELDARLVRGWIALARGDISLALKDAERALEFSREAADPQNLYPALALRARTLAASDQLADAAAIADELLQLMREQPSLPSFWVMDLAITLARLDRGDELAEAAEHVPSTRWLEAAAAYVAGDQTRAADLCVEIGALPEEAYARLDAADVALAAGRRSDAEEQISRAREFYSRATAASYSRRAEALLVP